MLSPGAAVAALYGFGARIDGAHLSLDVCYLIEPVLDPDAFWALSRLASATLEPARASPSRSARCCADVVALKVDSIPGFPPVSPSRHPFSDSAPGRRGFDFVDWI